MDLAPADPTVHGSTRNILEIAIRLGVVALLGYWCFVTVSPFFYVLIWGVIIAVAMQPICRRLRPKVGNKAWVAALIMTFAMLLVLVIPTLIIGNIIIDNLRIVAEHLREGTLAIAPPPESVGQWPLIGPPLVKLWNLASTNLTAAVTQLAPQIKSIAGWTLRTAAKAGVDVLQFVISVFIAGILLARAESGKQLAQRLGQRLAGDHGTNFVELAESTVRSVARGVIGTALIQSALAAIGFLAVGLPIAGLWILLCVVLSIVQIGIGPVIIGVVIYVFATKSTVTAVLFLIWGIFVVTIDNVIKPLLFGRGVKVPMVVVFIGAIGGLLHSGILGLFLGAVILSLCYELFLAWLNQGSGLQVAR